MALLGNGAMLLWFDIAPEAVVEHDHWHTHEHLPERLSIPGFKRGTRWIAASGSPRYFVMYEVADVGVLASQHYLERLDHPTPWTAKMMPAYRGMTRGLCAVTASSGLGVGHAALSIRLAPAPGRQTAVREWLTNRLPALCSRPGLVSAHLLESSLTPRMTAEQQIRGRDSGVDWVLLVTGYDQDSVSSLQDSELRSAALEQHGAAAGQISGIHRLAVTLTDREAGDDSLTR
jgi:hypothetical protein